MWEDHLHRTAPSRSSIYSGKNKWNNLWGEIWKERDVKYKVAFEFFMQIANPVLKFYLTQKNSSLLNGCGKQIRKDSGSYTINKDGSYNIKDGWLFPLISSKILLHCRKRRKSKVGVSFTSRKINNKKEYLIYIQLRRLQRS